MKKLPLVSIIAVCYNHAKYVIETLESIKNQTYSNIELIIMDDCSTDNSVEVIKLWIKKTNYPCRLIAHQENQGLCKTLNEALRLIKGEYYQGLACDDVILKEKIKTQVKLFKELKDEYAVIYSDAYLMNDKSQLYYGNFIQRYKPKILEVPYGNIYQELINTNFIPAMSVLIKTDLVRKIDGYDEKLTYEDYDLWLRLAKNYKFYFSNYKSCKYRIHDNNMHTSSKFDEVSTINTFYIFKKHIGNSIARRKVINSIYKMYKNGNYLAHKNEIILIKINNPYSKYIKRDISFKNYSRIKRIKSFLKFKFL
ncbi:glycosyltransferase [Flavobacterium sp. CS20]|uniref:glycosyltransferase family 2 protein n=1 Tax=Flavobacterium sp. CS20 TaxID=2775246 RepID=UPI001B3A143D|nr:glycosyltransferase [Flavobacterium sp. CS20]QTY27707.1 glycosyltransferase [Flavobacterium sp. CS20]